MIKNDKQQGTPFVDYTDTKANIESLPNMRFGAHAVATDNPTAPFGLYTGAGGWLWYSTGSVGGGSGSPIFQRNLTANLSEADGESLVVSGYVNQGSYDIILAGDSVLHLIG